MGKYTDKKVNSTPKAKKIQKELENIPFEEILNLVIRNRGGLIYGK